MQARVLILRIESEQLAECRLRLVILLLLGVDVRQPGQRILRFGIEVRRNLIFLSRGIKILLVLQDDARRDVGIAVLGIELGRLRKRRQRLLRVSVLEHVSQGLPGARFAFGRIRCWRQLGCGPEVLCRLRTLALTGVQNPEVQVRLEYIGLGSDRLAVRFNGVIAAVQLAIHITEIEPCPEIVGFRRDSLLQQRRGSGKVTFLHGRFGRIDLRRAAGSSLFDSMVTDRRRTFLHIRQGRELA